MMPSYTFRRYQHGDEKFINELYNFITHRKRTPNGFFWQWLDAPGGRGEIWLIEAKEDDGKRKLIGHHGVMPIRFSFNGNDLLFGKTENTFVHQVYRTKILYPRFEARFRNEYESRFHALFSTVGPKEAIRQRKAQGYKFPAIWKIFTWCASAQGDILYHIYRYGHRIAPSISKSIFYKRNKFKFDCGSSEHFGVKINCYTEAEARKTAFFREFWPSVKNAYGVTPSRNFEDLKWRFWDNPYIPYHTLAIDSATAGTGIAIVCMPTFGVMRIEDFAIEHPQSKSFGLLLNAVIDWSGKQGAFLVQFTTTDDSVQWVGPDNFNPGRSSSIVQKIMRTKNVPSGPKMPRKICNLGKHACLPDHGWYVTRSIFEGIQ